MAGLAIAVATGVGALVAIERNGASTEATRQVVDASAPSERSPSDAGMPTTTTPAITLFCDAKTATETVRGIVPDASWTRVSCMDDQMVLAVTATDNPQVELLAYFSLDRGGQWSLKAIMEAPGQFVYGDATQIPTEIADVDRTDLLRDAESP
jgi:hypothetical protein